MTNVFSHVDRPYSAGRACAIHAATNDTLTLTRAALGGVTEIWKPGYAYHRAGVLLTGLMPDGTAQPDLFAPPMSASRIRLMAAMDQLNQEHGRGTVRMAAEGLRNRWTMKSGQRSPRYTTCWSELPKAM